MKVLILKGGKHKHQESIESAKNIFFDIKDKVQAEDVYIDKNNIWHSKGRETTPHFVLPHYDKVIDTTHISDHHKIIRDVGIENILHHDLHAHDYRKALQQSHVRTPNYKIYKTKDEIHQNMHSLWRQMHLPILVKGTKNLSPKLLAYNPNDLAEHTDFVFAKGEEVMLEDFIRGRHYHVLTISNFRNKKTYRSIILESIDKKNYREYIIANSLTDKRRQELEQLAEQIHELLDLKLSRLDFVMTTRGNFYLVNVSNKLNMREGGATAEIVKNSGISFAEILSQG